MTEKELKARIAEIRRLKRKVTASKSAARNLLVKAGIKTKSGKFTRPYR
jgi:hypothetical protein